MSLAQETKLLTIMLNNLPSCRHGWAGGFIAERKTSDAIDFLNHLEHRMKQAILLDNCTAVTRRNSQSPTLSGMHHTAKPRKDRLL